MPYGERYRPDRLFLPQQVLLNAEIPTPFYLYDEDGIRKTARTIRGSFALNSGHTPFFPMRVNCAPAVLRVLGDEGFGLLAQSVAELRCAMELGFCGTRLLFHTPAMTPRAAKLALEAGAGVIFDAPGQLDAFDSALPERCLLRYHPGKSRAGVYFSGTTEKHKSGMSREQIFETAQTLVERGVEMIGLHCHLGSNSLREPFYPAAAAELFSLARELCDRAKIRVFCCDIGGGIGVSDLPGEPNLNLPHVGALVRSEYERFFSGSLTPALYTELGRFVTARHGILLSRVAEVRDRTRCHVIIDASTAQMPRILLHHITPHISVVGNCSKKGRIVCSIHGSTSDAQDRFHDRAILHELRPGDLVAIHTAGAYAESMQMSLAMLPRCPSFLYTLDGRIVPTVVP